MCWVSAGTKHQSDRDIVRDIVRINWDECLLVRRGANKDVLIVGIYTEGKESDIEFKMVMGTVANSR